MRKMKFQLPCGRKKSRKPFCDFLLGVPLYGGGYSIVMDGAILSKRNLWCMSLFAKRKTTFKKKIKHLPSAAPIAIIKGKISGNFPLPRKEIDR